MRLDMAWSISDATSSRSGFFSIISFESSNLTVYLFECYYDESMILPWLRFLTFLSSWIRIASIKLKSGLLFSNCVKSTDWLTTMSDYLAGDGSYSRRWRLLIDYSPLRGDMSDDGTNPVNLIVWVVLSGFLELRSIDFLRRYIFILIC